MIKNIKEKTIGATSSVSGAVSILGSWQICHNVCLGVIAILGLLGISVIGMPLMFLTKLALPFWIAATALFLVVFYFYIKKKCISKNIVLINAGVIIAGTPFSIVQILRIILWIIGGIFIITGIYFFIKEKIQRKKLIKMRNKK